MSDRPWNYGLLPGLTGADGNPLPNKLLEAGKPWGVSWHHRRTGHPGGNSEAFAHTYDEAQKACDRLNHEHPDRRYIPIIVAPTRSAAKEELK